MNAKQTAFLAAHAAALPAAVTAPGLSAMIEALPRGRAVKALETRQEYATIFDAEERAIATLIRPRVIGGDGLFTLSLSDGRIVAAFSSCPTVKRCLEAAYSYAASRLPADCDPAEELDSYRESFNSNWFTAQASQVGFPVFRASSLTLAARWARRIALAWEAMGSPTPRAIESGPVGEDWQPAPKSEAFYAQEVTPEGRPGRFAFGPTEERAEALARMTAAPAPDGRKTLDELEEEAAAALAEERAKRKTLDELEEEAAAALAEERAKRKTLDELEEEARQAPAPRPMAERAGLGDAIRRGMAPDVTPAPFFGYPLAPTRAAPAPLWPVQPRRAFADLARVMGGR